MRSTLVAIFTRSGRRSGAARFLSAVVNSNEGIIPTRHSRHLPPAACLSKERLVEITQEILESKSGTLIRYKLPHERDDAYHAWEVADETIQKVEWLVHGYSAQVKDTQMNKIYSVDPTADPHDCVEAIGKLLLRMEKEGEMYMNLREEMRSQISVEERKEQIDSEEDDGDELIFSGDPEVDEDISDVQNEISVNKPRPFASPGQTVVMFDSFLDTLSLATDANTPDHVRKLVTKVMQRFDQDGGLEYNTNPNTVPTQMTYNAALRAIANTENLSEKTRDDALLVSFEVFESLKNAVNAQRNAATYAYMIQIISKFFPPSEMSGNLAHALWQLAIEDQVIDTNVMRGMELIDCRDYEKYEKFMKDRIRGKTVEDLPQSWRKYGRSRRYKREDETY